MSATGTTDTISTEAFQREQIRQRLLMQALRSGQAAPLAGWTRAPKRADLARGLAVYTANAAVNAERALGARYPTVQAMLGAETFGPMARAFWRQSPPGRGDLAQWGDTLPAFLAEAEQLADLPYLADVARLDDAVAQAEGAEEVEAELSTLMRLGDTEPDRLVLRPAPGLALVASAHPVVTVWRAHHDPQQTAQPDPFADARAALAARRAETALVWRQGWTVRVAEVDAQTAAFLRLAFGQARPLAAALGVPGFDVERWLAPAVADGLLVRIDVTT
ncbi:DNA-binding domain-containing protein [Sphaerotilus sp.]|uniref:DNA-binding domain-containing protein n=1 Tax=Sphaerotilus sp. TaxID=2093942 RepID=UPI002ACE261B|nr:DNA-binding domain-containing protein [Sphaerotilus sp.]MDZ7855669.1 DNA-binding domain-containing protein [Sphaerotilus sp.]